MNLYTKDFSSKGKNLASKKNTRAGLLGDVWTHFHQGYEMFQEVIVAVIWDFGALCTHNKLEKTVLLFNVLCKKKPSSECSCLFRQRQMWNELNYTRNSLCYQVMLCVLPVIQLQHFALQNQLTRTSLVLMCSLECTLAAGSELQRNCWAPRFKELRNRSKARWDPNTIWT